MSEYIKREEAISQLESLWDKIHDRDCLIDPDCELGINESIEVIKAIPAADVVKGAACKECRFRNVCQQEIKMLGPGIVYEYSLGVEGCSLGERIEGKDNECK